eukprot:CAMPEP_0174363158 /NCGR_PEP_ID=MMETSP0811_2-20130205/67572_1 /TAXON_ID=73025 ORGANISM="Eutreptiella gymnastica-like, Strain CCMP1594" /NCGR_SAMPLE_ID=MMETSP0811_2 /ASSEMBLY_ACC=CAM_ASM_000667 /LENGTH=168 /DNA_ID=CAMNT_0015501549 /DNA_START=58 /DNA_END=564 /DNA_ORIENTATION=-
MHRNPFDRSVGSAIPTFKHTLISAAAGYSVSQARQTWSSQGATAPVATAAARSQHMPLRSAVLDPGGRVYVIGARLSLGPTGEALGRTPKREVPVDGQAGGWTRDGGRDNDVRGADDPRPSSGGPVECRECANGVRGKGFQAPKRLYIDPHPIPNSRSTNVWCRPQRK